MAQRAPLDEKTEESASHQRSQDIYSILKSALKSKKSKLVEKGPDGPKDAPR